MTRRPRGSGAAGCSGRPFPVMAGAVAEQPQPACYQPACPTPPARVCCRQSLAELGTLYVDLFLLHAPGDPGLRAETWRALEDAQKEVGAVRAARGCRGESGACRRSLRWLAAPTALGWLAASADPSAASTRLPCICHALHPRTQTPLQPGLAPQRPGSLDPLQGLIRSIGVSNFGIPHLKKLAQSAAVQPAVNQIEVHPWLQRRELVAHCKAEGIVVEVSAARWRRRR